MMGSIAQSFHLWGINQIGFKKLSLILFILILPPQIQAGDGDNTLKIVPDRCISLHQGQVCYQFTTLSWQMPVISDYCLFQEGIEEPLKCWDTADNGTFKIDFQSSTPVSYQLQEVSSHSVVASSTVTVAWVYKSKKRQRRSWRLF
jgi:hypothetical protein